MTHVSIIFLSETTKNEVEKIKWVPRLRDLNLNALTLLPQFCIKGFRAFNPSHVLQMDPTAKPREFYQIAVNCKNLCAHIKQNI